MDTDYLTPMAYECISLADVATDVLRSELGAACSQYRSEDEYLRGILVYVKGIEHDPESYLDRWDLLEQAELERFKKNILALRKHIEKTINTPMAERGEPEFKL